MVALLQRLFAALLGGTALWLSFPDAGLWWAAAPGVALITLATRGAHLATGGLVGLVAGLALFVPLLRWSGIYVGADAWLALAGFEASYLIGMGILLVAVQRWTSRFSLPVETALLPLLVGACWVVQEWVRSTIPWGGFPWARLAFSQAEAPTLAAVRWVTAAGLSAWVGAIGGLLALACLAVARRRAPVVLGTLAGAAALTVGPLLLPVNDPTGGSLDVLAVQGDAPQSGFRFNENAREVLTNHTSLVHRAAEEIEAGERPQPDVVFLPENASDVDPTRDEEAAGLLAEASWAIDTPMLVGAILREPSPMVSNAVLQYLPGQGPVARYDKQHPVPFGEWIPHRDLFRRITPKVDLVPRDFASGDEMGAMDVPTDAGDLRVGMGICFEVAYDDLMRVPVVEGSELLFIPTNNASFGITDQSTQQLAISRVRAMEHARSVVHISTVGVSALLGPDGSILSSPDGGEPRGTELFEPALLSASLPLNDGLTLATRLGNWPTWVLGALVVPAAVAGLLPPSTRRGRTRTERA
ncbi:apolipoprotein N-acyltransferase [Kytococcus sedentarius]|uniref:apolipoprotein N-acyltransferase n=1 Tax=Kytococcus sedentarius TaxID=1276 RepID=UPI0035BC402E